MSDTVQTNAIHVLVCTVSHAPNERLNAVKFKAKQKVSRLSMAQKLQQYTRETASV